MDFFRLFSFLVCAPAFDADDLEGQRLQQIIIAIEKLGFSVTRARKIEDAELAVQADAAIGCMVADWSKKGLEGKDRCADQSDAPTRPRNANCDTGAP